MEHVLCLQDSESNCISLFELRNELPRGKGASVVLHSEKDGLRGNDSLGLQMISSKMTAP